uniref:Bromo domain-containing protein n=1 Tax=Ascaris lumbricoides TaxID=6252 RepID=A0A0M3HIT5_ASCLU
LHLHNKIVWFLAANTLKVPDYRFLADRVYEVVKKYEEEVAKIPEDKLKELIVPPMIGEKFQEDNNTKHVAPTKVTDAAQAKNEAEAKNVEQPPLPPPPAAGAPPV